MTGTVVVERILVADPNIEVVTLDSTDNRTYTSRKFRVINHALIGKNDAADDNHINVVTDGTGTVTIKHQSGTGEDVTLVLFGHLGGSTTSGGL